MVNYQRIIINLSESYDISINGNVYSETTGLVGCDAILAHIEANYGYTLEVPADSGFPFSATLYAPVGQGASANGDVIQFRFYNGLSALLNTLSLTLSDGVDAYTCPGLITETTRLLNEDSTYILNEDGTFINLE
jgi:hypothetical protein